MEAEVLAGANDTVRRCRPLLYVENDRKEKAGALLRAIDRLGYVIHRHEPPLFNPANFLANPTNVFGKIISRNLLCVHRDQKLAVAGGQPVAVPAEVD